MAPCSVCKAIPPLHLANNKLSCCHEFCADCYKRYIDGSLIELSHHIRCCICGDLTILTHEDTGDKCFHQFGRDLEPTLKKPKALFWTDSGHFIVVDAFYKRIFVFDANKRPVVDFAYIHGCEAQNGVIFTLDGHIVLPLSDGKYVNLAYYNIDGELRGTVFLKPNTYVTGMALADNGDIMIADGPNGCVYTLNQSRKVTSKLKIHQLPEEHSVPYPQGVASRAGGDVIITDTANNRTRVYDKSGEIVDIFGSDGQRPGQFKNPTDVSVHENGNILVTDSFNQRVQLFNPRGRFTKFIVQYREGDDVYMIPVAMVTKGKVLAILLRGNGEVQAGEVRLYKLST